jgi:hypothetical protein
VAVEASFDGGTLATKPLRFDGSTFSVNCNTSFGKLGIRILNRDGKPIDGYETTIEGIDLIEHSLRFRKPLSELGRQAIRIEFTLSNAQLYSFSIQ